MNFRGRVNVVDVLRTDGLLKRPFPRRNRVERRHRRSRSPRSRWDEARPAGGLAGCCIIRRLRGALQSDRPTRAPTRLGAHRCNGAR